MISLVLPYWDRQEAADRALLKLWGHYARMELEVVIVDDGSPRPFMPPYPCVPPTFDVKVVRLQQKSGPLNPCVPYNRGVEASRGEFIALSNPEILHTKPVLQEMMEEVERGGPLSYVAAAAWCPEQGRWHCHGSRERTDDNDVGAYLPQGSDYHFMTMMHRSLWDRAGGFDEDYRLGAGYDDPDFVRRLHRAGAKFIRRDDLVVEHPRVGAHADWKAAQFARNRALFMSKWEPLRDREAA